jgi:DNA polymerase III epsilon subunit-like protein
MMVRASEGDAKVESAAEMSDPNAAVDALLRDPALARLDALPCAFDPLAALGWSAKERAHTRFLAWLLDPRETAPDRAHGLTHAPLTALLGMCFDRADPAAPQGVHELRVWREERLGDGLAATARAPDVRCEWSDGEGTPWVLVLEDKLDAAEGDEQLADYLSWMRRHRPGCRRLLVYLSPDGRAPASVSDAPELRVLRWGDLSAALLRALPPGDTDALRFARTTLTALVARFDPPPDAQEVLDALFVAHPAAMSLVGGAAGDPALRARVKARFPNAAWRLQRFAPRAFALTRTWAERVRACFNAVGLPRHRLTPGNAGPVWSWSLEGVTDRVGMHVMVWPGHLLGSPQPRAFVALHAPNVTWADAVRAREHTEPEGQLPEATRAWLRGAVPLRDNGGGWKWLRVGETFALPRALDEEGSAARLAETLHTVLDPHLNALGRAFADPTHRLYSVDLDLDHLIPVDVHDREALHRGARADARHALIVCPADRDHAVALRACARLGALFAETYGGTGALSYDYDGALALGLRGRGRPLWVVPVAALPAADLSRIAARVALVEGDVILLGAPDREARAALGPLLRGCVDHAPVPEAGERALKWLGVTSTLRDLRGLEDCAALMPSADATVAATADDRPVVLAWRVGASRVVLLGASVTALHGVPERFGRWVRALLHALDVVAAQAVVREVPEVVPAPVTAPVVPRRALAPAVRKRSSPQAVMPWAEVPKIPRGAQAGIVTQDLSDVVIVDTETTGLSSTARLVEIGALHVRAGVVVDRFQTLVDPEESIPKMVVRVHGITDAMVKGAPPAGDAIRAWLRFAAGRPVLAHNASFDHRIIAQECRRTGVGAAGVWFWCTKRFAKAAFPKAPGYGLAVLSQWLKLPSPPAHRALADCATTHGLLAACRATATDTALSHAHGPPKSL